MKIIEKFLNENEKLLHKERVYRALYVCHDYFNEVIVFQIESDKCFVFEYACGKLAEIRTEKDAMNKYMMLIPESICAEYETFAEW